MIITSHIIIRCKRTHAMIFLTSVAQLSVREAELARALVGVPAAIGREDLVPAGGLGPPRAVVLEAGPGVEDGVVDAAEEVAHGPEEGHEGAHDGPEKVPDGAEELRLGRLGARRQQQQEGHARQDVERGSAHLCVL